MFRIFLVLLFAFTFTFKSNIFSEEIDNLKKVEIKTSAVCEHCKETIEGALQKVSDVKTSNLDVDSKIVTVEYDSQKTNIDEIKKAISKAGYDADDVKKDSRAYKRLRKCCKVD